MKPKFSHPETQQFFEYWDSLRKSQIVPDRKDFDPIAIYKIMSRVLMVEYFSEDDVKFRIVGTSLTEDIGFDPTQKSYFTLLEKEALGSFWQASTSILTTPCGGYFQVEAQSAKGYIIDFNLLDLPMTNKTANSNIIIAHVAEGKLKDSAPMGEFRIRHIHAAGWIDIGAGVPDISITTD